MGEAEQRLRASGAQRVMLIILFINLAVAIGKALFGWWSQSLAVSSDAIHSFLDAASNVVGMVALRLASSPPDEGHPYGHRKFEILGAATMGVLIAAGSVRFGWSAIEALVYGGAAVRATSGGIALMVGTLFVYAGAAWFEARRGRALGSAFLIADAAHTSSDVLVSVAVIASLVLSRFGIRWADSVGALGVLVVVAIVAWRILGENLGILLDRVALDAALVKSSALAVAGVAGAHRIRSRGVAGAIALDLHITVDGELSLTVAHALSHAVEARLRDDFPGVIDVTIHLEPHGDPEEGL